MINRDTPPTIEEAWDMDRDDLFYVIASGIETMRHVFEQPYVDTTMFNELSHYVAELAEILEFKTAVEYTTGNTTP